MCRPGPSTIAFIALSNGVLINVSNAFTNILSGISMGKLKILLLSAGH
jgi:hypothetical protein